MMMEGERTKKEEEETASVVLLGGELPDTQISSSTNNEVAKDEDEENVHSGSVVVDDFAPNNDNGFVPQEPKKKGDDEEDDGLSLAAKSTRTTNSERTATVKNGGDGSESVTTATASCASSSADNNNRVNSKNTSTSNTYNVFNGIYELETDSKQNYKAIELVLFNFSRPHMRAFHYSWICFFISYFIWFCLAPLIGEIRNTFGTTSEDIWSSHITSYAGALIGQLLNGPLCDAYGARLCLGITLILISIPTGLTGLVVHGCNDLIILRFFTGFAGTAVVSSQYWTSQMFVKEVAGTANALAAGWGNVGGGVAPLIMGSVLFPLFKAFGLTSEQAWRTVCLVPATVAIVVGALCLKYTDDSPRGSYKELKKHDNDNDINATNVNTTTTSSSSSKSSKCTNLIVRIKNNNMWIAFKDINAWMLFIQYAMCSGVELTMNNAIVLYFIDVHDMSTEQAAGIASIFGLMNIFARALGGYISDWSNFTKGMRGRLIVQVTCLIGEGIFVWIFAHERRLGLTIVNLIFFSLFVQMAEGSTYGIIPYVNPHITGSITGFVSAGGAIGAIVFAIIFRQTTNYHTAFLIMAFLVLGSTLCTLGIHISGLAGLLCGNDCDEAIAQRQNTFQPQSQSTQKISSSSSSTSQKKHHRHHHHHHLQRVQHHDHQEQKETNTNIISGTGTSTTTTNTNTGNCPLNVSTPTTSTTTTSTTPSSTVIASTPKKKSQYTAPRNLNAFEMPV